MIMATDGVLTEAELQQLFTSIDMDCNGIIDTTELTAFMAKHLSPFEVSRAGVAVIPC